MNPIGYTLTLVFFVMSYVEYSVITTANTGMASLFALMWQNVTLAFAIITGGYLYFSIKANTSPLEEPLTLNEEQHTGLPPSINAAASEPSTSLPIGKIGYLIALILIGGYQIIKHLSYNAYDGTPYRQYGLLEFQYYYVPEPLRSTFFHLGMLLLSASVAVRAASELHFMMLTANGKPVASSALSIANTNVQLAATPLNTDDDH